jgi:hypothetical protein
VLWVLDQTSVTYEIVATVDQTVTVVGTVMTTETVSVDQAETDEAQTETVSTIVTVVTAGD